MTKTPDDAMRDTTRALIAATERRLAEALEIKSPAELGIKPDRSKNGKRRPGSIRHRAIR